MAIFLTESSRVIVQGMTGSEGQKHTARMLAAGTAIVGGVNPRKAGTTVEFALADGVRSIPVFGTVADAVAATGADVSVVFVPPAFAKSAVIEAVDAGVPLVVIITEGIPVADTAVFFNYARAAGVRLIGPNCPGLISPGKSNVGITPADITGPGRIGLVSKSGTLTYQMMYELRDLGFSTAIGIGVAPDLADHHDRVGLRVRLESGQCVDVGRPDDRVTADADRGREPEVPQLVHHLVGERPGLAHQSDPAGARDVGRSDAHVRLPGRDQPRQDRTGEQVRDAHLPDDV